MLRPIVLALCLTLITASAALAKPAPPAEAEEAPAASTRLAQDALGTKLIGGIEGHYKGNPGARLYAQIDRPLVRPGETIWFQSWRLGAKDLAGVGKKGELACELFNARGQAVVEAWFEEVAGLARGDVTVPEGISGGLYTFRVSAPSGEQFERPVIVSAGSQPRFKKQLRFVRKAYGAGDQVTAVIEVRRQTGEAMAGKSLSLAPVVEGRALPRQTVTTDEEGRATLRFALPDKIDKAEGLLTVLVEDGGITESIARPIPILTRAVDLGAFPEGGDLVVGLRSRVYFQARRPKGAPADVSGHIVDDRGRIVAHFDSDHQGMGRFEFTPRAGRRYHMDVLLPEKASEAYALPKPLDKGCVLRVFDDFDSVESPLRLRVRCTEARTLSVIGMLRERVVDSARVSVSPDKPAIVYLEPSEASLKRAQGVVRVTVFDALSLTPLAERLVYRHRRARLRVEIAPDKSRAQPRDKIKVKLRTLDDQGRPVAARLALSAVDDTLLSQADDRHGHILSALYLSPEIPGEVKDIKDYFDLKVADSGYKLDLLLGTRGWRRFVWTAAVLGDKDRDGVMDLSDRCPKLPEDKDGYEDEDGCPEDQDTDGDGLTDSKDACPDEKGPEKFYGCREMTTDADGDGIRLPKDKCPTEPEDKDGFMDEDGCPDYDNDHDGIPDFEDQCPNEPETIDGVMDEDGCPDQRHLVVITGSHRPRYQRPPPRRKATGQQMPFLKRRGQAPAGQKPSSTIKKPPPRKDLPSRVVVSQSQIQVVERIYFAAGSDRIQPRSFPLLNEIAEVMLQNPFITKVSVDGHTDSAGPAASNQRLSQRRAEAVRRYLIERGIATTRLVARGYGETRPIVRERNEADRAKNRRVEFNILETDGQYTSRPKRILRIAREFPAPDYKRARRGPRTDFRNTLHWAPLIQTSAKDGRAEVTFHLSDAITSVRITTEGVGAGLAGRSEALIASVLPFNLSTVLPPEVSTGDKLDIPVTLENHSNAPLSIALKADFGQHLSPRRAQRTEKLAAGQTRTTFFSVQVTGTQGLSDLHISARSGDTADSVKKQLKITPRGFPQTQAFSGIAAPNAEVRQTIRMSAPLPGSAEATLTFFPSALSSMQGALSGMLREPTGCFEQTSSKNYPNVMILSYLDTHPGADPKAIALAQQYMARGYKRLQTFEIKDGAFSWFGRGAGDVVVTAFGLMQFNDMKRVYPVSSALLSRIARWLRSQRDGKGNFKSTVAMKPERRDAANAYIIHALTEAGDRDLKADLDRLAAIATTTDDPYLLALAVLSLQTSPAHAEAAKAAAVRLVGLQDDQGGFTTARASAFYSNGVNLHNEATALATLALLRDGGHEQIARKGVYWLHRHRRSYGGWGATQATVLALKALTHYISGQKTKVSSNTLTVLLNGRKVAQKPWRGLQARPITFNNLGRWFTGGDNTLVIETKGPNELPFNLTLTHTTTSPDTHPKAPLSLTTALDKPEVSMGESVRLSATLKNTTGDKLPMAIARIGIPAGLELQPWQIEKLARAKRADFIETRPRELTLYFTNLRPNDTRQIDVDLTATVPGQCEGPASQAYLYYTSDQKFWAAPLSGTVVAGAKKTTQ